MTGECCRLDLGPAALVANDRRGPWGGQAWPRRASPRHGPDEGPAIALVEA